MLSILCNNSPTYQETTILLASSVVRAINEVIENQVIEALRNCNLLVVVTPNKLFVAL